MLTITTMEMEKIEKKRERNGKIITETE